jgi:hypothetical protein
MAFCWVFVPATHLRQSAKICGKKAASTERNAAAHWQPGAAEEGGIFRGPPRSLLPGMHMA